MAQVQTEATGSQESVVEQAQQKIQQGAGQTQGALRNAVGGQVDERSSQLGQQLREVARAVRQAGEKLQSESGDSPARFVDGVSDRMERAGSYLEESNSDRLISDAEHFGRRNPWLVIAGGAAVGVVLSRLLKASSNRRFDHLRSQGYNSRQRQWAQLPAPGDTQKHPLVPSASVPSDPS